MFTGGKIATAELCLLLRHIWQIFVSLFARPTNHINCDVRAEVVCTKLLYLIQNLRLSFDVFCVFVFFVFNTRAK